MRKNRRSELQAQDSRRNADADLEAHAKGCEVCRKEVFVPAGHLPGVTGFTGVAFCHAGLKLLERKNWFSGFETGLWSGLHVQRRRTADKRRRGTLP